jgi:mono/diheme cytochrome c family protein
MSAIGAYRINADRQVNLFTFLNITSRRAASAARWLGFTRGPEPHAQVRRIAMKCRSCRLYLILMLVFPLFHLIARQVTALEIEMVGRSPSRSTAKERPTIQKSKEQSGTAMAAAKAVNLSVAGKLYTQYCQRCHDQDGSGRRGRSYADEIPDFRSEAWHGKKSDAVLTVSILEGKGTAMPAFGERLNHDQAQELVAFIRALDPPSEHAEQSTAPVSKNAPGGFDKRFSELRRQLEELRKQYYELSPSSAQKP